MQRYFQLYCLKKYDYHSEVIYIQGNNSKDSNREHSRLFREWITFSAKSEIFLTMLEILPIDIPQHKPDKNL